MTVSICQLFMNIIILEVYYSMHQEYFKHIMLVLTSRRILNDVRFMRTCLMFDISLIQNQNKYLSSLIL